MKTSCGRRYSPDKPNLNGDDDEQIELEANDSLLRDDNE